MVQGSWRARSLGGDAGAAWLACPGGVVGGGRVGGADVEAEARPRALRLPSATLSGGAGEGRRHSEARSAAVVAVAEGRRAEGDLSWQRSARGEGSDRAAEGGAPASGGEVTSGRPSERPHPKWRPNVPPVLLRALNVHVTCGGGRGRTGPRRRPAQGCHGVSGSSGGSGDRSDVTMKGSPR